MVKTRSGKSYGKKPDIPLMRIHDLVPQIIAKMHNLELVRMRRTCSAVNMLVEKRTPILSKRVMRANFTELWNEQSLINITINIKKRRVNGRKQIIDGDLKTKLGPLAVNEIRVKKDYNFYPTAAECEEYVQWLRQMRFHCVRLIVDELPTQTALDMLESIEQVAQVKLSFRKRLSARKLHMFSISRHASFVELDLQKADLHKTPVETLKKFKGIKIYCYRAQALDNFIKDIQSTKDCGNLMKIEYEFNFFHDNDAMDFIEVPFPELYRRDEPYTAIYCMELETKQMVLIYGGPETGTFKFFFVEKGAKALTECFLANVRTKSGIRRDAFQAKFTQASFEEKGELISEVIYEPLAALGARRGGHFQMSEQYSSDTESESELESDVEGSSDSE